MVDPRNILDEIKGMDNDRIRLYYSERTQPFGVAVTNLGGGLNMGVIVRSANAFGAQDIFYVGKKHWDRRSAVGVFNYSTVNYLKSTEDLLALKNQGYTLVAIENNTPKAQNIYRFAFPSKPLFVFGEEGTGIEQSLLDGCDNCVYIPQLGTVRSLNVSVAAGIVMSEFVRTLYAYPTY
jgi:tRNA G18 (ribose-2'-O)-methylase SpoU